MIDTFLWFQSLDQMPTDSLRKNLLAMAKHPCFDEQNRQSLLQVVALINNLESLSNDEHDFSIESDHFASSMVRLHTIHCHYFQKKWKSFKKPRKINLWAVSTKSNPNFPHKIFSFSSSTEKIAWTRFRCASHQTLSNTITLIHPTQNQSAIRSSCHRWSNIGS